MIQDSYFGRGVTHAVCQDYATHRPGLAVLSDGCSTSRDTDIGARLLSLAALKVLGAGGLTWRCNEGLHTDICAEVIARIAHALAEPCGVSVSALNATLGVLRATSDHECNATLWGDGVVVIRKASGELAIAHLEYSQGAPCYLAYRLMGGYDAYMREFGTQSYNEMHHLLEVSGLANAVVEFRREVSDVYKVAFTVEPGDTVIIMSDGVNQFHNTKTNTPVPWQDIVKSICDFKRFVGDFVNARMRFFDKECRREGIVGHDDLSVIAIHRPISNDTK